MKGAPASRLLPRPLTAPLRGSTLRAQGLRGRELQGSHAKSSMSTRDCGVVEAPSGREGGD